MFILYKGSNVNANYEFFNSLYIINNNLVEQRFLGKQSSYTVFGHIPDSLGKMYTLWKNILNTQLANFPNLYKSSEIFLIKDFEWNLEIWKPFYQKIEPINRLKELNETIINQNEDY
jgi:hypothetical protein